MRKHGTFQADSLQAVLSAEIGASASARLMHRLHCVLLVLRGMSCCAVANLFGESARSVERWVKAYERGGIEALKGTPHTGRPARLSASSIEVLTGELRQAPRDFGFAQGRWTGDLLALHVARRYGVRLGARQCQRLLRGLRLDTR